MSKKRKTKTITGYLIRFNEKPINGIVQSRNLIDTSIFDAMIDKGEIINYEVDNIGVKIETLKK